MKTLAALVVATLAAFFALGGWQMVRLHRGPVLAPTAASDAESLRTAVLENERSGNPSQRAAFDAFSRDLVSRAAALDAQALSMEAARALAIFDNAHTHVTDSRLARVPLRFHWFTDGLYVVKARPEHAPLLGAKVLALEGRDPEEIVRLLDPYIPGVPGWKRYRSEYFLSAPAALRAIGLRADAAASRLALRRLDGTTVDITMPADAEVPPSDAFREFRHALPMDESFGTAGWARLADRIEPKPPYLRDMPKPFARLWLQAGRTLYVRLNGSVDSRETKLEAFLDETLRELTQRGARNAIVDLRFDWGGDYMLTREFSTRLADVLPADGHVVVITGPNTFSAGLILAARLKRFGGSKVTFVGEPVGDRLHFWAEGFEVMLPRSKVETYLSTASHDLGEGCRLLDPECFILDKFAGAAIGELSVETAANSFADFMAGPDRPLERACEIAATAATAPRSPR